MAGVWKPEGNTKTVTRSRLKPVHQPARPGERSGFAGHGRAAQRGRLALPRGCRKGEPPDDHVINHGLA